MVQLLYDGCQQFHPSDANPLKCEVCGCHKGFHDMFQNIEDEVPPVSLIVSCPPTPEKIVNCHPMSRKRKVSCSSSSISPSISEDTSFSDEIRSRLSSIRILKVEEFEADSVPAHSEIQQEGIFLSPLRISQVHDDDQSDASLRQVCADRNVENIANLAKGQTSQHEISAEIDNGVEEHIRADIHSNHVVKGQENPLLALDFQPSMSFQSSVDNVDQIRLERSQCDEFQMDSKDFKSESKNCFDALEILQESTDGRAELEASSCPRELVKASNQESTQDIGYIERIQSFPNHLQRIVVDRIPVMGPSFKCQRCGVMFQCEMLFSAHVTFKCKFPKKSVAVKRISFGSKLLEEDYELVKSFFLWTNKRPFQCKSCLRCYSRASLLLQHYCAHPRHLLSNALSCHFCSLNFEIQKIEECVRHLIKHFGELKSAQTRVMSIFQDQTSNDGGFHDSDSLVLPAVLVPVPVCPSPCSSDKNEVRGFADLSESTSVSQFSHQSISSRSQQCTLCPNVFSTLMTC
jgi:hypothetical protein